MISRRYTQEQIEEILEQVDLECYLDREGITYRRTFGSRGEQLNVRECPVCGSNSWKVYLNAETGLGNCFAGDHPPDERYNKFSFIKAHLGEQNFGVVMDHIKEVAREMGWRARRLKSVDVDGDRPELRLPKSLALPIKGKNLLYLEGRGIDLGTAQYFHMRYSHDGVFWYRLDGNWRKQDYSRRVILPVYDLDGKLVSFQGRDITGKADKKYLFPPGFASTGSQLYNGMNARLSERVVVGEGVFDVAALKIALDQEQDLRDVTPIGTFGKHLSHGDAAGQDQLGRFIELKAGGLKEVTFMWDGEQTAIDAAVDAAARLKSIGLIAKVAVLPPGKDPNEVAPEVVRKAFWEATPVTRTSVARMKMKARYISQW